MDFFKNPENVLSFLLFMSSFFLIISVVIRITAKIRFNRWINSEMSIITSEKISEETRQEKEFLMDEILTTSPQKNYPKAYAMASFSALISGIFLLLFIVQFFLS